MEDNIGKEDNEAYKRMGGNKVCRKISMKRRFWMEYQKTQNIKIHSEIYLYEKLKQP